MLQTTIETLVEGMETKDTSNHDTIIATMDNNILADWINAKVEERGWSYSDTARAAQVKISQDKDTVAWELARIDEQLVLLPDESERHMRVELIAAMPDSVRLLQEDEARVLLRDVGVRVWCENREVVRVEPEIE